MCAIGGVCVVDPGTDDSGRGGNIGAEDELDSLKALDGFEIGEV